MNAPPDHAEDVRSNAQGRARPMRSLFRDLAESLRNPEFWALSGWLDIVVRSRQSRLGILWLLMPVAIYVWGVGFFFAGMMGIPLVVHAAYIALGYVVFRCVSSIVTDATGAFSGAGAFILDGHIRLTDFVLRVVATAAFHVVIAMPVVAVALFFSPETQWQGVLVSLAALPVVVVNAIWAGILLALVGARFIDLRHLVGSIFMFAFLLTPVVWSAEMMPAGSLRGLLMRMNPIYHLIEIVRAPILGDAIDAMTFPYLLAMTLAGWCFAILAYRRYARYVPLWI